MDARCAFHQNQVATFTCERCGNFGCELCRALTKGPRCAACFARGQEEVRQTAPPGLDFQQTLTESLKRPWAKRVGVLAISVLPAIPAAIFNAILDRTLTGLGPPFTSAAGGTTSPFDTSITPADLDRLVDAFAGQEATLVATWLCGFLFSALALVACTAMFASEPLPGGVAAQVLRRFVPGLFTSLAVALALGVASLMCCLPFIPALGLVTAAVPATVLGGAGPFSALRSSAERVWPHLWTVVGVELVLWSLMIGAGIVASTLTVPLQLALGSTGVMVATAANAYVTSVLGTTRMALGVIVFEKLKPPTA